jgi:hypothetical protein
MNLQNGANVLYFGVYYGTRKNPDGSFSVYNVADFQRTFQHDAERGEKLMHGYLVENKIGDMNSVTHRPLWVGEDTVLRFDNALGRLDLEAIETY